MEYAFTQQGQAQCGEHLRAHFRKIQGGAGPAGLLGAVTEGLVAEAIRRAAAAAEAAEAAAADVDITEGGGGGGEQPSPEARRAAAAEAAGEAAADLAARVGLLLEACAAQLPMRARNGPPPTWAAVSALPREVSESALRAFRRGADSPAAAGRAAPLLRSLIADGLVDISAAIDALCPAQAPNQQQPAPQVTPLWAAWAHAVAAGGGVGGRRWNDDAVAAAVACAPPKTLALRLARLTRAAAASSSSAAGPQQPQQGAVVASAAAARAAWIGCTALRRALLQNPQALAEAHKAVATAEKVAPAEAQTLAARSLLDLAGADPAENTTASAGNSAAAAPPPGGSPSPQQALAAERRRAARLLARLQCPAALSACRAAASAAFAEGPAAQAELCGALLGAIVVRPLATAPAAYNAFLCSLFRISPIRRNDVLPSLKRYRPVFPSLSQVDPALASAVPAVAAGTCGLEALLVEAKKLLVWPPPQGGALVGALAARAGVPAEAADAAAVEDAFCSARARPKPPCLSSDVRSLLSER